MFALNRSVVALAVVLFIVVGAPVAAQAEEPPAPSVTTLAATDITETTATFHAKVSPNSTMTTGYFVYGIAPDQLTLRTREVSLGAGSGEVPLDAAVLALSPNTEYYVVAVVENDDWIVTGGLVSFSTLRPPVPEIVGGSVSDITHESAMLHLNVVTHGKPVTVSGSVKPYPARGRSAAAFGPVPVTVDGDIAIPLPALTAGTTYMWSAIATNVVGDARSSGTFRSEALIVMPRPMFTPLVATYGSNVTISGTILNKPGLVVTLARQVFPFDGPIQPLTGTVATTDATGAYAFDLRVTRPVAYGVTAGGAATLAAGNLTRLKVAPAVTAKAKRARRHHRYVVAGRHQPAVRSVVSLYRRGAGRVGDERVSYGTFRFPARVLKPGKYEVRVTPDVDTGFVRGESAVFTIPRR
jgi:hypothetical protein